MPINKRWRRALLAAATVLIGRSATAQVTPAAGHTPPDDTPNVRAGATIFTRAFDSLKPSKSIDARRHRLILGIAYWFPLLRGPSAALLVDMERATFDAPFNRPNERRYSLHALLNY